MKRTGLLLCALLLSAAVLLWARDDHMINSSLVPAAQGTVHTDNDRNGNTGIEVKVNHLARPHDLAPGYSTYVVWVRPPGQQPINIGELGVNDNLQGTLHSDTPYKKFDIFVTPENNPRAEAPSGPELLRATVNRE